MDTAMTTTKKHPGLPEQTRLVIYDLDGTLVDSFEDIRQAANRALAKHGLPTHPIEAIKRFVGDGAPKLIERCLGPEKLDLFDDVFAAFIDFYKNHPAGTVTPYPGVPEALQVIHKAGIAQAVLTNKLQPVAEETCESLGLTQWLDGIWGDDQKTPHKPDPTMMHRLLDHFGLTPECCVMVGDGRPDCEVAQAVAMPVVGVSWGMHPRKAIESFEPTAIIDAMELLPTLLGIE